MRRMEHSLVDHDPHGAGDVRHRHEPKWRPWAFEGTRYLVRSRRREIGFTGKQDLQAHMTKSVHVLNGSNLNMLGKREPHIYGKTTLAEIEANCLQLSRELGLACIFRQTNYEGQMVDWLQEAFEKKAAVVINPAGFSFHSIPVLDALKMIEKFKYKISDSTVYIY